MSSEYNPTKEFLHYSELKDHIFLDVHRQPEDEGKSWQEYSLLIENFLLRHPLVDQCAMDPKREIITVALSGKMYDIDELEAVDKYIRQLIGKIATHDFK